MSKPHFTPRCGTTRHFEVTGTPSVLPVSPDASLTLTADVPVRIGDSIMVGAGVAHPVKADNLTRKGLIVSTLNPERRGTMSVTTIDPA